MSNSSSGKNKKRGKAWHRGKKASNAWLKASERLPVVDNDVDYTSSTPKPIMKMGSRQLKGDAL